MVYKIILGIVMVNRNGSPISLLDLKASGQCIEMPRILVFLWWTLGSTVETSIIERPQPPPPQTPFHSSKSTPSWISFECVGALVCFFVESCTSKYMCVIVIIPLIGHWCHCGSLPLWLLAFCGLWLTYAQNLLCGQDFFASIRLAHMDEKAC